MLARPAHVKLDVDVDDDVALRLFKIRTAYTSRQRTAANVLVERRYSWRGYDARDSAGRRPRPDHPGAAPKTRPSAP